MELLLVQIVGEEVAPLAAGERDEPAVQDDRVCLLVGSHTRYSVSPGKLAPKASALQSAPTEARASLERTFDRGARQIECPRRLAITRTRAYRVAAEVAAEVAAIVV